jgi:hypothetical protein
MRAAKRLMNNERMVDEATNLHKLIAKFPICDFDLAGSFLEDFGRTSDPAHSFVHQLLLYGRDFAAEHLHGWETRYIIQGGVVLIFAPMNPSVVVRAVSFDPLTTLWPNQILYNLESSCSPTTLPTG